MYKNVYEKIRTEYLRVYKNKITIDEYSRICQGVINFGGCDFDCSNCEWYYYNYNVDNSLKIFVYLNELLTIHYY